MAILNTDGTQYAFSKIKNELNQLKSDLDSKVKYTDSLTYEEIMASTDLTNKVASASALLSSKPIMYIDINLITDDYGRAITNINLNQLEPIGARIIPDDTKDVNEGILLININWQSVIYLTLVSWNYILQKNKSFKARLFYIDKFK